jgi:hypothetical protein
LGVPAVFAAREVGQPVIRTRRALLVLVASAFVEACKKPEFACIDTTGLSADEIQARTTLDYNDRTSDPSRACASCQQFVGSSAACGSCKLLKGPIHPLGSCRTFTLAS